MINIILNIDRWSSWTFSKVDMISMIMWQETVSLQQLMSVIYLAKTYKTNPPITSERDATSSTADRKNKSALRDKHKFKRTAWSTEHRTLYQPPHPPPPLLLLTRFKALFLLEYHTLPYEEKKKKLCRNESILVITGLNMKKAHHYSTFFHCRNSHGAIVSPCEETELFFYCPSLFGKVKKLINSCVF